MLNLIKNIKIKKEIKKDLINIIKEIDKIFKSLDEYILSKKEKKILKKAHSLGNDIDVACKEFGWEWEGDHFHKPDGTVVKRSDYC